MKNLKKLAAISAVSIMLASSAYAEQSDSNIAVGANISSLGLGIEARMPIVDTLVGRIGINYGASSKNFNDTTTSIDLWSGQAVTTAIKNKLKVKFLTVPLMLDWHPIDDSGFRVSAGVAYNGSSFKTTSTAHSSIVNGNKRITIKGKTYDGRDVSVSTKVKFTNPIAPVLTIGYDNSFATTGPFSFNAELGAMFMGKAKVSVSAKARDPRTKAALEKAIKEKFNKVNKALKVYPIISIGFKYSF